MIICVNNPIIDLSELLLQRLNLRIPLCLITLGTKQTGIQKVMEQKDRNQGIIGVVADIIKVEKKYETAIETALGGNIQNIVTDDEETAKEMIEFLKKNRYGRATFLPLTSITNPQEFKTPDVLNEKGAIGLADSLVQTEKRYSNVAKAMQRPSPK